MKKTLLLAALFFTLHGIAQDESIKKLRSDADKNIKKDPNDTIPKTWKIGGIYNLNLSQASLSNWAAGGDEFSFSLNSLFSAYAFIKRVVIAGIIHLTSILAL